MGSGKGRSKRVRSITCSSQTAEVAEEKWTEWQNFVWGSKLEEVPLHNYYLGHAPEDITDVEYEKILTELLADSVAVGAITLPSPYRPDDFVFHITNARIGFHNDVNAGITLT